MSLDKYPYLTPTDADMALPADEFIAKFDGILYEPLFTSEFTYWIWVVFSTALFVTVNVPSAGLNLVPTARCLSHWASALIFAFFGAAGVIIFLIHKCREKM